MQSFEAAAGGSLSVQDFRDLHTQLSPIIKKAMYDMIVAGAHSQAPHLRLTWLSKRFQSEADSLSGGRTVAAADTVVSSLSPPPDAAAGGIPPRQSTPADLPPHLLTHQAEVARAQVDAMRAELRDLEARLAATGTNSASNPPPPLSPPTAVASPVDYATCMALSAARRDLAHMKAVFERHKDVEGGLSKAALVAALKEVDAPVLSSSEGASEDSLFRRADTNLSGAVDQNECAFLPAFPPTRHSCSNATTRRFMLVANLPDDLEMFLADHNLSVSAAAAFPPQRTCHSLLLCSLLHRRSGLMHPVELTSWAAWRF
jgi:hypothetical protein